MDTKSGSEIEDAPGSPEYPPGRMQERDSFKGKKKKSDQRARELFL